MQLHETIQRRVPRPAKQLRTIEAVIGPKETIAEINAYIAIRDGLMVEAEQIRTNAKVDSLAVANDFVVACLRTPRPPYQEQCLPEASAAQERIRCEQVKTRIVELKAEIAAQPHHRYGASAR